jgi:Raf kinase inhibitor-like YbhB/YbcL family protein
MRRSPRSAAVLAAIALAAFAFACGDSDDDNDTPPVTPEATDSAAGTPVTSGTPATPGALSLTSPAFDDNATMPEQYTCDGVNISPPLTFGGAPEGTESLALVVIDIDGPGGGFVHWTLFDMDPETPALPEDAVPVTGTEGATSINQPGYFGPCPPSGEHRYVFTLSALDTTLGLDASATAADIAAAMEGHILEEAQLTGIYAR